MKEKILKINQEQIKRLNIKRLLSMPLAVGIFTSTGTIAFVSNSNYTEMMVTPQKLVEENIYGENGNVTHEYIWKDSPSVTILTKASESEQLDAFSSWVEHNEKDGLLKHRAAKISPNAGSSAWYACLQTDYAAWHYSRARIVKTLGGKILEDSNQVQVNSGTATARTPEDKLYLLDWDFSLRSYWGI